MKSEQIKEITEKATEQLVAALQQGHWTFPSLQLAQRFAHRLAEALHRTMGVENHDAFLALLHEAAALVPSAEASYIACIKADFGADAVRPKSVNTTSHVEHVVRAYLVPRFGDEIAEDIKPFDIQRWLKSLHEPGGLAWTTISKMRGIMSRIYKIGILHEHVAKNPVQHVETRSKRD
jgi:hypothetical protein